MRPIVLWLLVAAVFATLLLGWAIAWWHDRNQREKEDAEWEKWVGRKDQDE